VHDAGQQEPVDSALLLCTAWHPCRRAARTDHQTSSMVWLARVVMPRSASRRRTVRWVVSSCSAIWAVDQPNLPATRPMNREVSLM
jgi:hypothetical protein